MSSLQFRNVDAEPGDDVATWPYEALVTAIDRGLVPDWQPIFSEIRKFPWGPLTRRIEYYLDYRDPDGVSALFRSAIERVRQQADQQDRAEVVALVQNAVTATGLTQADFADLIGTSASRLNTYMRGKTMPSAAMLIRIERTAYSFIGFIPDYSSPDPAADYE